MTVHMCMSCESECMSCWEDRSCTRRHHLGTFVCHSNVHVCVCERVNKDQRASTTAQTTNENVWVYKEACEQMCVSAFLAVAQAGRAMLPPFSQTWHCNGRCVTSTMSHCCNRQPQNRLSSEQIQHTSLERRHKQLTQSK